MKRFATTVSLVLSLLCAAGCAGGSPEITGQSSGSETEDAEETAPEDGMEFTFTGSAVYRDGKIFTEGKPAVSNTAQLTPGFDSYVLSADVTLKTKSSGGICFSASDRDNCLRLNFGETKRRVQLSKFVKGDIRESVVSYADMRGGVPFTMYVERTPDSLRILFGGADGTLLFDIACEPAGNLLILDCGPDGGASFENVRIEKPDRDGSAAPEGGLIYKNPILPVGTECADPYILCHGGRYYLYSTNAPKEGYRYWYSDDLVSWKEGGFCLLSADVFGTPTDTAGFWAPEVYRIERGGKECFLMLYTVNEHVGAAISESPEGPFVSPVDNWLVPSHCAIDPTLFTDDDGKTYLFYVGWGGVDYGIYGRTIDLSDFSLGRETHIISPEKGKWETAEGSVTEGPFVLKHNGTYYLTYSGNDYRSKKYAVGYATSDSPLGSYAKSDGNPILSQLPSNGVYGPGHHAFFTAADGTLLAVYHRHASADSVWPRVACIDRVRFVDVGDGPDRLVIVGPTVREQVVY